MAAEDPVDELYRLRPEEFVAARDALMKRLKAGGDKERAAEVRALRRPTVAAWAVNQVARSSRKDVAELTRIGDRLRDAHQALLDGGGDAGVREANAQRRALVATLTKQALALLGEAADGQGDAITHTFDAAVADPEAGLAVRGGRLSKELPAPSGFGTEVALGSSDPAPANDRRAERRAARRSRKDSTTEAGTGGGDEGRRRLEQLEQEVRERTGEAQQAAREAAAARQEVSRLQDLLVSANARAKSTADRARLAQWKASTAQQVLREASEG